MNQLDVVGTWLKSVAYSHPQSKVTDEQYKRVWSRFRSYTGEAAEETSVDHKESGDRTFRRQYAQYIRTWIAELSQEDLANISIAVIVGTVKSCRASVRTIFLAT